MDRVSVPCQLNQDSIRCQSNRSCFGRLLLAAGVGAAQSSFHSQRNLSRWRGRDQLDMRIRLVLQCTHFELLAKIIACPTDSVEKIHQQVPPSWQLLQQAWEQSVKAYWAIGDHLRRSTLIRKLNCSWQTTAGDCLFVGETIRACSSICVVQHRLL